MFSKSNLSQNYSQFFDCVYQKTLQIVSDPKFHPTQRKLLQETLDLHYKQRSYPDPFRCHGLLTIFYLIVKAWCKKLDERSEHLGVFCLLYLLALDLLDDIQDKDLDGKPHADVTPSIAIHNAMVLFGLAIHALHRLIRLESDAHRRSQYLDIFEIYSIKQGSGQYSDLLGNQAAKTPEDVMVIQEAKASSLTMIIQFAALIAECSEDNLRRYLYVGEKMASLLQIVDDIQDIFGNSQSSDLKTEKYTYLLACFWESATPEQRNYYQNLSTKLPDSLSEIRSLLYQSGAIRKSAQAIEQLRLIIHTEIAATGNSSPFHRNLLCLVDAAANLVYKAPLVQSSRFIWEPRESWHQQIRQGAIDFSDSLKAFNPPQLPLLLPWHLPTSMCSYGQTVVIYYPDLEGQAQEIIPNYNSLLNISEPQIIQELIQSLTPVGLVHEFFRYWRFAIRKSISDKWIEELNIHRLATAYIKFYQPRVASRIPELIDNALAFSRHRLSNKGLKILYRLEQDNYVPQPKGYEEGYEVELDDILHIQLIIQRRFYKSQSLPLYETLKKFLFS